MMKDFRSWVGCGNSGGGNGWIVGGGLLGLWGGVGFGVVAVGGGKDDDLPKIKERDFVVVEGVELGVFETFFEWEVGSPTDF